MLDPVAMPLELGDDMVGIVVEEEHPRTLAAAALLTVAELDDHHVRRFEHAPRDPERRLQPVRLDAVGEAERPHQ